MSNTLITISGNINSGKDTVALMLNFLNNKWAKEITKISYEEFELYRYHVKDKKLFNICHFADAMKISLSNIFSIPINLFYSREYKDNMYYAPSKRKFYTKEELSNTDYEFVKEGDLFKKSDKLIITNIRSLMQNYSETIKSIFGNNVWAYTTRASIINILSISKFCIVPDLRFINEYNAISNLHPITIRVNRDNANYSSNHISDIDLDNNNFKYNFNIDNNSSEEDLFKKVQQIYINIML